MAKYVSSHPAQIMNFSDPLVVDEMVMNKLECAEVIRDRSLPFVKVPVFDVIHGQHLIKGTSRYGTAGELLLGPSDVSSLGTKYYDLQMMSDTPVSRNDLRALDSEFGIRNDAFGVLSSSQTYHDPKPVVWRNGSQVWRELVAPIAAYVYHFDFSWVRARTKFGIDLVSNYGPSSLNLQTERRIYIEIPPPPISADTEKNKFLFGQWVQRVQLVFLWWPHGRANINPVTLETFSQYTDACQFRFGTLTAGSTASSMTFAANWTASGGAAEVPRPALRTLEFKRLLASKLGMRANL